MEAGQGDAAGPDANINMEQISTMTLDEFKKLLNSALSVPQQAAAAAAAAAAGRGDLSSANQSPYRRTNSLDHASGSGDGPTPRPGHSHRAGSLTSADVAAGGSQDPKARRSLPFAPEENHAARTTRSGASTARPQTPTSVSRPTSLALSSSRPKTPSSTPGGGGVSRPKTPTSSVSRQTPTRSSVTPTRTTAPAAAADLEDEDMPDFVNNAGRPTTPGLSRERPSTPSLIPRPFSAIPRPVTPAMRGEPAAQSQGTTPVARGIGRKQPAVPGRSQGESNSYSAMYARRCVTPGPGSSSSSSTPASTPQQARARTPGPDPFRPAATASSSSRDSGRALSRSLDLRGRSRSTADLSKSLSLTSREISISGDEDDEELVAAEERGRGRSKMAASTSSAASTPSGGGEQQRRKRSGSVDSKKRIVRQEAFEGNTTLMVTRTGTGNHNITVTSNDKTYYSSTGKKGGPAPAPGPTPTTPSRRSVSTVNPPSQRDLMRQRAKTPDPSAMMRAQQRTQQPRTRPEPRAIISRPAQAPPSSANRKPPTSNVARNSTSVRPPLAKTPSEPAGRLEAWVSSTVAQQAKKKQLPPRPKRSMTPGPSHIPDSELESRSLEEIKAALLLPLNGVTPPKVSVEPTHVQAPPEDPEMYQKMELLFERYREMELRASVNVTPGAGPLSPDVTSDVSDLPPPPTSNSGEGEAPQGSSRDSESSMTSSLTSGNSASCHSAPRGGARSKASSGSSGGAAAAPQPRRKSLPASPRSLSLKSSTEAWGPGTSSSPSSQPRPLSSSRKGSAMTASNGTLTSGDIYNSNSTLVLDSSAATTPTGGGSSSTTPASRATPILTRPLTLHSSKDSNPATSTPVGVSGGVAASPSGGAELGLEDVEGEVVSQPTQQATVLVSKIKEILKVRPRNEEAKGGFRSRIPAPSALTRDRRSKSFSSLLSPGSDSASLTLSEFKQTNGHQENTAAAGGRYFESNEYYESCDSGRSFDTSSGERSSENYGDSGYGRSLHEGRAHPHGTAIDSGFAGKSRSYSSSSADVGRDHDCQDEDAFEQEQSYGGSSAYSRGGGLGGQWRTANCSNGETYLDNDYQGGGYSQRHGFSGQEDQQRVQFSLLCGGGGERDGDDCLTDSSRSETPVPKLARPLTTGRSTFISRRHAGGGLVRALSQDASLSNSLSSLSSKYSLAEDEPEYV